MTLPSIFSEPVKAIGTTLFGTATAGAGIATNNLWATLLGSAIGAGGVAYIFGIRLRDWTFAYLRKQNDELNAELLNLSAEVATLRKKHEEKHET